MKKILAISAIATISVASCSAPWNRAPESPAPSAGTGNVSTPEATWSASPENPPVSTGTGSVPAVKPSAGSVPPKSEPSAATGSATGTTSTGAAGTGTEDEEYRDALGEIDRLFDGIAGDSGSGSR